MSLGPVCFLLQLSVGLGAGTVRHSGGSSFASLSISPAAQLLRPSLFLGAGGSASLLEGGGWAGQARVDLWAAIPPRRSLRTVRLAASTSIATTTRTDGAASGVASLLGEVLYMPEQGGGGVALGVGSVAGALEGAPGIGSPRVRARGWLQRAGGTVQYALSIESTRFLGAWYSDLVGGVSQEGDRVTVGAWISVRTSSAYGSTGAVSGSIQYFLTPSVAAEVAGGSYLRDPFQALPRAAFVSAGLRLHAAPRPARARPPAEEPRLQPLVAQRRGTGDTVVVRFRMDAERSLAIAGDWNGWEPVPLNALGDDIWEAVLVLRPGTYQFNLYVDDTEWVVPGGVAIVRDGMGGLVALLTVL